MQLGSENLAQSRSRVQQTAPSLGRFVVSHTIIAAISLGQAGRGSARIIS
jgi:hypothetical protein